MMKKVLIVNNNMHIGGVQKSLVNLLNAIGGKYDITLLLFSAKGALLKDIPQEIKVTEVSSLYKYIGMTRKDVEKISFKFFFRCIFAFISRFFGRKYAISFMGLTQRKIGKYDVAISFLHNSSEKVFYGGCNEFVLKHVEADKKIAIIHCDYAVSGANTKENDRIYKQFDEIAACSEGCRKSFVDCIPELEDRVKVIPNFHNFEQIKILSEINDIRFSEEDINIVTVARLGREKGVLRAVEAINRIKYDNKIKYHIIGDGIERNQIQQFIKEKKLEDVILMYGEKENPYPYIKAADLLLIPSVSEAAPMVIGEAAFLGVPILSTCTSSAEEMIKDTGYGWVCENSVTGLADALMWLLEHNDNIEQVKNHIKKTVFSNKKAEECIEIIMRGSN